jgi:ribonucleotide reductase beta subunit family protein with ferritin-like domain
MELHPPQTLYRKWEESQWSPWDIDLDADRSQWRGMASDDRSLVLWALSSLMVAEGADYYDQVRGARARARL